MNDRLPMVEDKAREVKTEDQDQQGTGVRTEDQDQQGTGVRTEDLDPPTKDPVIGDKERCGEDDSLAD